METASGVLLGVVGALALVKVGDAVMLIGRILNRHGPVGGGEIESPVWEWASALGSPWKQVVHVIFRAPVIVLVIAVVVSFFPDAPKALLLCSAALGVLAASAVIAVLFVAILETRSRGGDVYWIGGLHRIRVITEGKDRGAPIDPMIAIPMITFSVVVAYGALYRALSIVDGHAFVVPGSGGLGVLDSMYFNLITATTVGYGDFQPLSHPAQLAVVSQLLLTVSGVALVAGYLITDRERAR